MGKERESGRLRPRQSRETEIELKQPLAQRVAAYALAAGAAGLGIMAGAQPAEAQIVYTPAHIVFQSGALLDLNNDGTNDFLISQVDGDKFSGGHTLRIGGAPGNGVLGYLGHTVFASYLFASRLAPGIKIGAGEVFYRGNRDVQMAESWEFSAIQYLFGPWQYVHDDLLGFLGLEFQIDGQAHYGWAEVLIKADNPYRGVVTGYAYNTVPNQPILAGQKSDDDLIGEMPPQAATLGVLALGAPGLDIWRPRKRDLAAE